MGKIICLYLTISITTVRLVYYLNGKLSNQMRVED